VIRFFIVKIFIKKDMIFFMTVARMQHVLHVRGWVGDILRQMNEECHKTQAAAISNVKVEFFFHVRANADVLSKKQRRISNPFYRLMTLFVTYISPLVVEKRVMSSSGFQESP
jgi:hypothetical protein